MAATVGNLAIKSIASSYTYLKNLKLAINRIKKINYFFVLPPNIWICVHLRCRLWQICFRFEERWQPRSIETLDVNDEGNCSTSSLRVEVSLHDCSILY